MVFNSLPDYRAAKADAKGFVSTFCQLLFWEPDMYPFQDLDHVDELGLPLARVPANADEAGTLCCPVWFERTGTMITEELDEIVENVNRFPHFEIWPTLVAVMRSISQFVRDRDDYPISWQSENPNMQYIFENDRSPPVTTTCYPFPITGSDGIVCSVAITLLASAEQRWLSDADTKALMSIGSTTQCNFCNKPTTRLKKCTRCEAIWYCSKECQKRDWRRHKPECVRQ
jgi:hypothetical protein